MVSIYTTPSIVLFSCLRKALETSSWDRKRYIFNEIDLMPHTSFCYNCILIVRAVFRHLCVYILWNIFVEEQSHCSACSVVLPITEFWFLVYHRDIDMHKYIQAGHAKIQSAVKRHLSTPWTGWSHFVNTFSLFCAKP